MSERFRRGVAFTLDPAHFSGQSTSQADEIVLTVTRDDRGWFLIVAEQLDESPTVAVDVSMPLARWLAKVADERLAVLQIGIREGVRRFDDPMDPVAIPWSDALPLSRACKEALLWGQKDVAG